MENTGVTPQSQSALSAEMVAELSAAATGYIEKAIKDSAEAAYAGVAKRIVAETLAVVGDRITTQLRGQTLFGGTEREPFPASAGCEPLREETVVLKSDDNKILISNYGRIVDNAYNAFNRNPGYLLTEEVIDYLTQMRLPPDAESNNVFRDTASRPGGSPLFIFTFYPDMLRKISDVAYWHAMRQIIDKYNEKYALAHNELHADKIKQLNRDASDSFAAHRVAVETDAARHIREIETETAEKISDMEAKIAAERKELELEREAQEETERDLDERRDENMAAADLNNAQARLLKIERAEFEAEKAADAAKRRTEAEIETSLKQIKIVRRQLAKENAALAKKSAELQAERARLTRLQERIADREAALEFVGDVSSDDEQ